MVIKTMMLFDSLFSRIVNNYEDLDISQFEYKAIYECLSPGKLQIKLSHKSRPTLVFTEVADIADFSDYCVANVARAFDSLLHQCCAALDIHLVEKGCE